MVHVNGNPVNGDGDGVVDMLAIICGATLHGRDGLIVPNGGAGEILPDCSSIGQQRADIQAVPHQFVAQEEAKNGSIGKQRLSNGLGRRPARRPVTPEQVA